VIASFRRNYHILCHFLLTHCNSEPLGSNQIKFTKEEKVHEILRDLMKQRYGANDDKMNADDIARVVTREETLELIKQARSLSMARNSEE